MPAADKDVPAILLPTGLPAADAHAPAAGAAQQRFEDAALAARRIAHDYGNLLTAILGFSDLALAQVGPDARWRPYLAEIHRAAVQGARLTDRLRLLAPRPTPPGAVASLARVMDAEEERLRPLWGAHVHFRRDLPNDLPPVAAEPDSVRQAVAALLDNAGESLDGEGTVTVTVSARPVSLTAEACSGLSGRPRPGPCVEVAVADTGRGLSPEARQRLLREPFFTTKPGHCGLGMIAVPTALAAAGGGVRLDAGPKGGTVARLYLPAAAAAPPGGEHILVVDDDPMVLRLVCATLKGAGYRPQPAADAAEALAAFARAAADPFRLVLSDVRMPRMGGLELARRLRERDPAVHVVFMSGQVGEDFPPSGPPAGDVALVSKPFRPEGLLRAVRAALDGRTRPAALPGTEEKLPQRSP